MQHAAHIEQQIQVGMGACHLVSGALDAGLVGGVKLHNGQSAGGALLQPLQLAGILRGAAGGYDLPRPLKQLLHKLQTQAWSRKQACLTLWNV